MEIPVSPDRQRVYGLGSHLAASDQYQGHGGGRPVGCPVCGSDCPSGRHPGRQFPAPSKLILTSRFSGCKCSCLDLCGLYSALWTMLLLCVRLPDEGRRLSPEDGHCARRGFALHFRCPAGRWLQSLPAELHQIGDGPLGGSDDFLDQLCTHRVS